MYNKEFIKNYIYGRIEDVYKKYNKEGVLL